jgi:DNA-binding NarL/FixJ family response regulator
MTRSKEKYTIAIADDHVLLRKALSRLINGFEQYSVVFEAESGNELKDMIAKNAIPDLVLMDVNMPNGNGYEATIWLHKKYPQVKILALSMYNDEGVIIKILKAGAKGYILKNIEPEELKMALDTIIEKDFYLPDTISGKVISGLQNDSDNYRDIELTDREKQFLTLLSTEMTYKEIASAMFVSPRTIDDYKSNLCEKFHVRTRIGLVMYAIRKGLVEVRSGD